MKGLLQWQVVSFVSRGIASALGIIQGILIIRILSVSDYGLVGIATSIGSVFGASQHLGLASGSTREIAAAKDDLEVLKIFFTSVFIRYLITIPLAVGLFAFSRYIAVDKYHNELLILPLRLYALVLIFQGVQSILNAVISGTHRFKQLFIYQSLIAVVSTLIFVPLVYLKQLSGYFLAMIVFNFIASIILGFVAFKPFKVRLFSVDRGDFLRILKKILHISIGIYLVKLIFTLWQRSGPLILGLTLQPVQVGLFSFALFYSGKLMMISDSVTDVNLPVLSRELESNFENFKKLFSENFDKLYVFILYAAFAATIWVREIVHVAIGGTKHDGALILILPLTFSFVFYSLINIIKSSVLIPAKLVKEMIVSFVLMIATTLGTYGALAGYLDKLEAMAVGMFMGAFLGFVYLAITLKLKLNLSCFNGSHAILICILMLISLFAGDVDVLLKSGIFVISSISYIMLALAFGILDKKDLTYLLRKLKNEEI